MPRLSSIDEEDFVAAVRDMDEKQRGRLLVGYLRKYQTELDRARAGMRLVQRVFKEGCCPHCSAVLFGAGNDDICDGPRHPGHKHAGYAAKEEDESDGHPMGDESAGDAGDPSRD